MSIEVDFPRDEARPDFAAHGRVTDPENHPPETIGALLIGRGYCVAGKPVRLCSNRWAFHFDGVPMGPATLVILAHVRNPGAQGSQHVESVQRPILITKKEADWSQGAESLRASGTLILQSPSSDGETLYRDSNGNVLVSGYTTNESSTIDQNETYITDGTNRYFSVVLNEPQESPVGNFYMDFNVPIGNGYTLTVQDSEGASQTLSNLIVQ